MKPTPMYTHHSEAKKNMSFFSVYTPDIPPHPTPHTPHPHIPHHTRPPYMCTPSISNQGMGMYAQYAQKLCSMFASIHFVPVHLRLCAVQTVGSEYASELFTNCAAVFSHEYVDPGYKSTPNLSTPISGFAAFTCLIQRLVLQSNTQTPDVNQQEAVLIYPLYGTVRPVIVKEIAA